MFYVMSKLVFENKKEKKNREVNLKIVVRTHKGESFCCRKGRRHNDAEASGAGKANKTIFYLLKLDFSSDC